MRVFNFPIPEDRYYRVIAIIRGEHKADLDDLALADEMEDWANYVGSEEQ